MAAPARGQRRNRPQQGQQQQQQGQPRQQLSMNDALATLQSMFDTVDRSVIQMVLVEGCSGNMEQAVEALLKITESQSSSSSNNNGGSGSNNNAPAAFGLPQPNEHAVKNATKSKRAGGSGGGRIDKKKNKEEMQNQLAQRAQSHRQGQAQGQQSQQQQQQQQQRRPMANPAQGRMVNLPDDFLRPPSYYLEKYPKDRRSVNEINNNGKNSDPNFDQKAEREKQIIEDEIFAKAIFEDALFAQDLMNHPEWISDNQNEFGINHNRVRSQTQINNNNNNNNRLKSPFKNNPFRTRRANSSGDLGNNNNEIDPSNPQARKAKFKENLNSLGDAAKSRMMNLASKLQRNKEDKRSKPKGSGSGGGANIPHGATYSNVLKSIDDETLIDDADDALEIDMASDKNRGTYKPPKPAQAL